MADAMHFLTMDFKNGFWQVKVAPDLQQYTTFTLGNLGFYEFIHMPFGLCNASVTFQHVLHEMLNLTCCVIYLNDVIVFGQMRRNIWSVSASCLAVLQVQLEVETVQVIIFPITNSVLGASSLA